MAEQKPSQGTEENKNYTSYTSVVSPQKKRRKRKKRKRKKGSGARLTFHKRVSNLTPVCYIP